MRLFFIGWVVMPLVGLTYQAWGRRLINDDWCRCIVTAVMWVGLLGLKRED